MIGDIDFDSCCYYQYASLDMDKLRENLKDSPEALARVDELVPVLLRVMAMSNPGGKQNTFAAHVLPDALLVEFKPEKTPLSYANAFAEPVSRLSKQISKDSADKLVEEIDRMDRCYALPVSHRAWLNRGRDTRQRERSPLLESFAEGATLRFDLLTHPSKKVDVGRSNSARVFLQTPEERQAWLARQGAKCGFELVARCEEESYDILRYDKGRYEKAGKGEDAMI